MLSYFHESIVTTLSFFSHTTMLFEQHSVQKVNLCKWFRARDAFGNNFLSISVYDILTTREEQFCWIQIWK